MKCLQDDRLGAMILVTGCAVGLLIAGLILRAPLEVGNVAHPTVVLPPDTKLFVDRVGSAPANLAISPDGSLLAFVARHNAGAPQLYLRSTDSPDAQAVPLSENAF